MRVLVTGAGGYIGGRLVPVLLAHGHEVVATFSAAPPADARPGRNGRWWLDGVQARGMDVRDRSQVQAAVQEVDAVVYLVHALADRDFATLDRLGAQHVAEAAAAGGVRRLVYLSGLVPDAPEDELSPHITSRLEVERILAASGVPTVTVRAAVVVGSGSTSFEVVRQVSERLPVQALPPWMASQVQPIAVVDLLGALAACLSLPDEAVGRSRSYDVGGPDRLSYAELLRLYADVARLVRPQLPLPVRRPPAGSRSGELAGQLAGRVIGAPGSTVAALMESLHHDMVCREESFRSELLPADHRLMGVREAMERALTRPRAGTRPAERDPMGPMPFDPPWSGGGVYLFDGRVRHRPRSTVERLLLGVRRPW